MAADAAKFSLRRQRGVALLMALVVMALAATLAAGIVWDVSLDQYRTANVIQGDQAMQYGLGAEAWAEQILRRDIVQPQNSGGNSQTANTVGGQSVNLTQDWAMQLPPLPVQGGTVIGHLQDLQGLFNLNNLVGAQATPAAQSPAFMQFQRLLTALNLDPNIAFAVLDWLNTGSQPHFPGGAKDETYTRLQPPYLTAERPMTSISELLLVNGVTPEVYQKLAPYVCALPMTNTLAGPGPVPGANTTNTPVTADGGSAIGGTGIASPVIPTPINVNTAPPIVLMSLVPNLDLGTATAMSQSLAMHPIQNAGSLNTVWTQLTNNQRPPQNVGVTSNYFRLTVKVQIGSAHLTMYSLLYRNNVNGGTYAIRRTFGTL